MKKIVALIICFSLSLFLVSCNKKGEVVYSTTDRLTLNIDSDTLKILQITDLHLTFGYDYNDRKTYALIKNLIDTHNPDIVVVTGDIMMSPQAKRLFKEFVDFMNELNIPWTFIFGNHENDYHTYKDFEKSYQKIKLFTPGLKLTDGGVGNYIIDVKYNNDTIVHLYFFDTKSDTKEQVQTTGYDYLSLAQIDWYESNILDDEANSLAFMHIPLIEYTEYTGNVGKGEGVYHQDINTGFFTKAVELGKTIGVFVGHDHNNYYAFDLEGIILTYGKVSGYNAYGKGTRGGRIITYQNGQIISNEIVLDGDASWKNDFMFTCSWLLIFG